MTGPEIPTVRLDETRKSFVLLFTGFFLGFGLILCLTLAGLLRVEAQTFLTHVKIEEKLTLDQQQKLVTAELGDVFSDLLWFSRQNELAGFLADTGDGAVRQSIAAEYLALTARKKRYDQVRFLDDTGMERVRVNYNNGAPEIVPASRLQDKSGRYYFQNTLSLGREDIYVSPLDLNVEKGRIEIPFKPVIRFGTPVFDKAGKKRGVIILNYLGDELLGMIGDSGALSPGRIMLVNEAGYWLLEPEPADEWGFMIPERKHRKFNSRFPGIWNAVRSTDFYQARTGAGLFTAVTIFPVQQSAKPIDDVYFWKLISHVPAAELNAGTRAFRHMLVLAGSGLFLASLLPSWIMAKAIVRRRRHRLEMNQYRDELENRVRASTRELRTVNRDLRQKYEEMERFNRLTVERELEMIRLKEEINGLLLAAGKQPKYRIVEPVEIKPE